MINFKKIFFLILISSVWLTHSNALIKDALFATIGHKAITRSDIENEVKTILILSNRDFSENQRKQLENAAVQSTIRRNIKQIEIEKYKSLTFSKEELNSELMRLANAIEVDLDTFKNIFITNGINFSIMIDQIKTELLWNSLIFSLYKDRLSINLDEIDEQLKTFESKKEFQEFLLSEIIINFVNKDELESKIEEIKNKINIEGFENVALNLSIAESAFKGGDLGWINENRVTEEFKFKISNTPVGKISEPIFLPEGILFFKVRDKRTTEGFLSLEDAKNQLVNAEKAKILKMHSLTHFENLRRTVTINYY